MKIGLFLGAGASVPFGKPTTVQLKEKLINFTTTNDLNEEILQSFLIVNEYSDIEYVLQAIRDIKNFTKSKGGNYFFTHGANGIFTYKNGTLPFDTFAKKVEETETKLENIIFDHYRWDLTSNKHLFAIYDELFKFLKIHGEEIRIFTTNYDRAVEQYCELRKDSFRCIDGFNRNPSDSEFAEWTGVFNTTQKDDRTNIFLYKLHGSLNWKIHVNGMLVKTNEEGKPTDSNYTKNLVIYPTLSPKDEEESLPYREIINHFHNELDSIDVCIVIGYSFRDSLNNSFKKFIQKGKTFIVISPNAVKDFYTNMITFPPSLKQHDIDNSNLTILNKNPVNEQEKWDVHLVPKKLATNAILDIVNEIHNGIIFSHKENNLTKS